MERRTSCARSRAERRALDRERRVKLSVVIPAHNEEGSVGRDSRGDGCARARRIDYEVVVVDDVSDDGTADVVEAWPPPTPVFAVTGPTTKRASGRRSGPASTSIEGDAVAIVMADASDDPEDLVRTTAC